MSHFFIAPRLGFPIRVSSCQIEVLGEELELLPQRAIYWKAQRAILVADLHLGKAGHFRKHGIPISRKVHLADLETLGNLIRSFRPQQVILLGDLFHSFENSEWNDVVAFLRAYDDVKFTLVEGNHDILQQYPDCLVCTPKLLIPPFSFTHYQSDDTYYNFSGHIHPGIRVLGRARQGITMPCFVFSTNHAILPAFGQFTGIKKIRKAKEERIFGVVENTVIELV